MATTTRKTASKAPATKAGKTAAKKATPATRKAPAAAKPATAARKPPPAPPQTPRQEAQPPAALKEPLTGEARYRWIAHAAYLRAEKRGFAPGHETDDWLAAEADFEAANRAAGG